MEGGKTASLAIYPTVESGELLLVGHREDIVEATDLLARLDVPIGAGRRTLYYSPQFISAARLQHLAEHVLIQASPTKADVQFFLDEPVNRLYVTASTAMQEEIRALLEREDQKSLEPSAPLRMYKPKNRSAGDLISTLAKILPNVQERVERNDDAGRARKSAPVENGSDSNGTQVGEGGTDGDRLPSATAQLERVVGAGFTLSHDEHTNTIIAVGPREFHSKLQELLVKLDIRQAQVLVELTLVAITFNDSMSLATELVNQEDGGVLQSLLFSSFGLSQIDLTTGMRTFNPGAGLNGVILGPQETPILFRTIAAHGNSRIMTTPKAVVSDNTTATISSVEEAPFTSINASNTVATTSFAGFESAGTTLTVTPHISQGDHLALDYSFNFSNFTGGGSVGVPPPRTTNTFSGTVEIPDGHTIVLGGLVTENETDSVTEVPLLGRIPLIGVLFQSSDRVRTKSRVFAFIRPTILRDDRFADLKQLSQSEIERASLVNKDFPESEYSWMR
jgi:general secretion pathway protein D